MSMLRGFEEEVSRRAREAERKSPHLFAEVLRRPPKDEAQVHFDSLRWLIENKFHETFKGDPRIEGGVRAEQERREDRRSTIFNAYFSLSSVGLLTPERLDLIAQTYDEAEKASLPLQRDAGRRAVEKLLEDLGIKKD